MGNQYVQRPIQDRFWEKVNKNGPMPETRPELGPCWVWTAGLNAYGYGHFWDGDKTIGSHQWLYESQHGPTPSGSNLDHLCRNKPCINPHHLESVPVGANNLRGVGWGALNARKTHCPQGHPYDEANTHIGRDGYRYCRICRQVQSTQAYERRKKVKQ